MFKIVFWMGRKSRTSERLSLLRKNRQPGTLGLRHSPAQPIALPVAPAVFHFPATNVTSLLDWAAIEIFLLSPPAMSVWANVKSCYPAMIGLYKSDPDHLLAYHKAVWESVQVITPHLKRPFNISLCRLH